MKWVRTITMCMCAMLSMFACHRSIGNTKDTLSNTEDERIARKVKDVVLEYCRNGRQVVPAKEAVAAMAAVVGERCIDAAGEYSARKHDFFPGQRVFSDKINVLLTGDVVTDDITVIPGNSVFGTIRDQLAGTRFRQNYFPRLTEIFAGFTSRIGKPEDWGKVPLSLPTEYWPEKLPLRVAFDTRPGIDAALQPIKDDKARSVHVCTLAMAMLLKDKELAKQIDPSIVLTLTFETINGMAKTAPMTDKAIDNPPQAMREAQHEVIKIGPR